LAGELQVWVDGAWYTITTRYNGSGEPIRKATSYVGQRMAADGLDVEYHVWQTTDNPNVIGEIAGLSTPDDIFIIGGHLDDVQGTPGADDNASGSVATMIAAELLSQYQWSCTYASPYDR
jgi:Zn-dependent M28 family amino/carboxypeptidase